MKTLRQFKKECMQDPEFAKEYKEMEEEFEEIRSSIESSMENNFDMTEISREWNISWEEKS